MIRDRIALFQNLVSILSHAEKPIPEYTVEILEN